MKLLMADDDKDDREMLKLAFDEVCPGDELELTCDGEELMKCLERCYAENNMPDLILLDLNMPKKDGKAALKEIKADPRFKDIPVVIYSTSNFEEDRSYTLGLGAKGYIVKPFEFNELLKNLQGALLSVVGCMPGEFDNSRDVQNPMAAPFRYLHHRTWQDAGR